MKCPSKDNPGTCGMRLDSQPRLGQGTYTAAMKAAPGEGMNTAFYLFSYGRNNDKSKAWNEIDIEILGKQIYGGKTRIWTNVWTGHGTQHYQLVTVNWDASKGYHTYVIQIDSSKIYWKFDGKTYRTFTYTGYSDLVQTINNLDFQGELALWGSHDIGWTEMGNMWNNGNSYPMYAYFKNIKLNKCTSCSPASGGGSSGGSSSKLKITNKDGINKWWYAVTVTNIPSGLSIKTVKIKAANKNSWETAKKEWDYYAITQNKPYTAPFDFKITTSKGETVTSYDVIKNLNVGSSGYMSKSVSAFTLEDDESGGLHWTVIAAIIVLIGCFICAIIAGVIYLKKRKSKLNGDGASFREDSKEQELTTHKADTPVGDDGDATTATAGYDMEPVSPEIEVEIETEA
eukprot:CAMPEP_0201591642 /NCGR_PEP_ID=MMETSP0190_2-20130828/189754_1 /ASSEMBLY_ACC=CAM_ASM_000263 /TAXON_ID=37353 /ORGANISM="Rosalina sp." /LENGTH=399 /DNA_ID=CAMNT_0048050053 /DNA_START=211 /DNA_END=1410 /DNA_ORIENTATION=+